MDIEQITSDILCLYSGINGFPKISKKLGISDNTMIISMANTQEALLNIGFNNFNDLVKDFNENTLDIFVNNLTQKELIIAIDEVKKEYKYKEAEKEEEKEFDIIKSLSPTKRKEYFVEHIDNISNYYYSRGYSNTAINEDLDNKTVIKLANRLLINIEETDKKPDLIKKITDEFAKTGYRQRKQGSGV